MARTRFFCIFTAVMCIPLVFTFSSCTAGNQPLKYSPKPMKGMTADQILNAADLYLRSYGAVRGPNQTKLIRNVSLDELEKRLDVQLPSIDRTQAYVLVILEGQFDLTGFPGNSTNLHPITKYVAVAFDENTGEAILIMSLDSERLIQTAVGNSN